MINLVLNAKIAVNGFICLLGSKIACKERHYSESDYDIVADEIINKENVEIKNLCKNEKNHFEHINLLNADDNELKKSLIYAAKKNLYFTILLIKLKSANTKTHYPFIEIFTI